jgi:hypothetical protein
MFKKLLILLGLAALVVFIARKAKSASEERALWHEVTTAPDLR